MMRMKYENTKTHKKASTAALATRTRYRWNSSAYPARSRGSAGMSGNVDRLGMTRGERRKQRDKEEKCIPDPYIPIRIHTPAGDGDTHKRIEDDRNKGPAHGVRQDILPSFKVE